MQGIQKFLDSTHLPGLSKKNGEVVCRNLDMMQEPERIFNTSDVTGYGIIKRNRLHIIRFSDIIESKKIYPTHMKAIVPLTFL
jgi:hypothetical protein